MKIILDEVKKEAVLVKKDGTEVSRYSYKNLVSKDITFEEFKADIDSFNETLGIQEEFDDIKDLRRVVNLHNW